MQGSFSAVSYTGNQIWCVVEGDTIFQTDLTGAKAAIGKTNPAYAELESTTQQYYDKLVELGAINPPKSPEQLVQEQQQALLTLAQAVQSMQAELKEMKNEHQCACSSGVKNVSERKGRRGAESGPADDVGNGEQP